MRRNISSFLLAVILIISVGIAYEVKDFEVEQYRSNFETYIHHEGGQISNPLFTEDTTLNINKVDVGVDIGYYIIPSNIPPSVSELLEAAKEKVNNGVYTDKELCEEIYEFDENGEIKLLETYSKTITADISKNLKAMDKDDLAEVYSNSKLRNSLANYGLKVVRDVYYEKVPDGKDENNQTIYKKVPKYNYHVEEEGLRQLDLIGWAKLYTALAIVTPGGAGAGVFAGIVAADKYTGAQTSWNACVAYKGKYLTAWDYLWDAAELSRRAWIETLSNATSSYDEMENAGIGYANFSGEGSDTFRELNDSLNVALERQRPTNYYEFLDEYLEKTNSDDPPHMSSLWNFSTGVWNALELVNKSLSKVPDVWEANKQKLENKRKAFEENIAKIEQNVKEAEAERCDKVSNVMLLNKGDTANLEAPAVYLAMAKSEKARLESVIDKINYTLNNWRSDNNNEGWLFYTFKYVEEGEEGQKGVPSNITNSCRGTVAKMREMVVKKIAKLNSSHYEVGNLTKELKDADNASTLGDKYVAYLKIWDDINLTLQSDATKAAQYESLRTYVRDLLDRAKKDNVEVTDIEHDFNIYVSEDTSYAYKIEKLNELVGKIESKIETRYKHLLSLRDDILDAINTFPESLQAYEDLMDKKDNSYSL